MTHKTHAMVPLVGLPAPNEECRYCRKCECHDRDSKLEKMCPSNPIIREKRINKQKEELRNA